MTIPAPPIVQPPHYSTNTDGIRDGTEGVLIHITGARPGAENSLPYLLNNTTPVSVHAHISREGVITQTLPWEAIGWHSGDLWYNRNYLGIEHELHVGEEPSEAQLYASQWLVEWLRWRYGGTKGASFSVARHSYVNPSHNCPGPLWPMSIYQQPFTPQQERKDNEHMRQRIEPNDALEYWLPYVDSERWETTINIINDNGQAAQVLASMNGEVHTIDGDNPLILEPGHGHQWELGDNPPFKGSIILAAYTVDGGHEATVIVERVEVPR